MSVAVIFNGQGAHYAQMGLDFKAAYPEAQQTFEKAEAITGYPISEWLSDDMTPFQQTQYAQVAITATSLAIYNSIKTKLPVMSYMAGLSLGEYTSLIAGEMLSFEEGMQLIKQRGQLMTQHCAALREEQDIAMEAVMNVPLHEVRELIAEVNDGAEKLFVANLNSSTQIIIAGSTDSIAEFKALAKDRGYKRMMPLKVEGPFHTPYMAPVAEPFAQVLDDITFHEGNVPVISNTTVEPHTPETVKEDLTKHLVESVRWRETIDYLVDHGVEKLIQIGPGKTLANLLKREPNAPATLVIDKVEDLDKLEDFIGG